MKKVLALLIALTLLAVAPFSLAEAASKKIVVGFVQQDLTHPFHLGEVEGAKIAAARFGFDLIVTSGDGDVTKQVQAFDNLLEQVDVIAVNTIDVTAFQNSFAKAKELGVTVIVEHSWDDNTAGTIGFDEWAMSREVGEYAVELLKEQGGELTSKKVVMLTGNQGQGLNIGRTGGFAEVMGANKVEIIAQEATNWSGTTAVTIMENYLTTYDKIDLLFGLSDGVTYPAAQVIINAGRDGEILICSIDGSSDAIQAIIDGTMDCTYLLASQYTGYYKALIPFKVITEKYDLSNDFILPGIIVTKDNAAAMLKLTQEMENNIESFPFDKPLQDIINEYLAVK